MVNIDVSKFHKTNVAQEATKIASVLYNVNGFLFIVCLFKVLFEWLLPDITTNKSDIFYNMATLVDDRLVDTSVKIF